MKSFSKKKALPTEMSLQITSMADIFTILLVFLLKSTATSMTTVSPIGATKLPIAQVSAGTVLKDSLKLEIAPDSIIVDSKTILRLRSLNFDPADLHPNGHAPALYRVLLQQRRSLPNPNLDSNLLVLADEKTPYSTIKPILASAALAGFVDLQLVVVQKE